jgi:hypothetical protein
MSLLALLAGILRVLLGVGRMFFALRVVVLSVLLGRGAMGLGGILVKFSCLIVGVFRHGVPPVSVGDLGVRFTAGCLSGGRPLVECHHSTTHGI